MAMTPPSGWSIAIAARYAIVNLCALVMIAYAASHSFGFELATYQTALATVLITWGWWRFLGRPMVPYW